METNIMHVEHFQLGKLINMAAAYGASSIALFHIQADTILNSTSGKYRPCCNTLILPGCELGELEYNPYVRMKFKETMRYAHSVILDQVSCMYVIKDRMNGITGHMDNGYYEEFFQRTMNEALEVAQENWDIKHPKK